MRLTVSLAQIDIILGDPGANLERVRPWVEEAARRGSDMLVFPELWTSGYDLERAASLAESAHDGDTARTLSGWAQAQRMWITGSFLARDARGVTNAAPWFGPQGQVTEPYRKIHLFGLMQEDQWLQPGDRLGLNDLPWGDTGLAICYDLRFPELFRAYALAGARLIVLPSEWPHPRLAHWQTLIRARAIENQCFLIAVNRVGKDRASTFCGHSAVIDPWGNSVISAGEEEVLLTVTIDLALVDEVRQRIPVFADRRPTSYRRDDNMATSFSEV